MAQMPDSLAQGEDDLGHIDQLQLKSGMEMEGADTGSPAEEHLVAYRVAAINQLPVEILSAIMVEFVNNPYRVITLTPRFTHQLVLSQVCRLWRQCAHATPRLWSSVVIWQDGRRPDLRNKDEPNLRTQTAFLDTCVTRARPLPLDLTLHIYEPSDDVDASLDIWRSSMSRCQSLHVYCPEIVWDELVSTTIELPLLDKLELCIFERETQTPLSLNSLAMPKLKHLEIDLEGVGDTPDGVDWSQLSTLAIRFANVNRRLNSVLHQCPALRRLVLGLEVIGIDHMCNITLPFLEDFYCSIYDEEEDGLAQHVFPSFVLPRLQKLTVYASDTHPHTKPLVRMLRRSGCMLEMLDIHNRGVIDNGDHFYELLMSCPALSSLTITGVYDGTYGASTSIDDSLLRLIRMVDGYPVPKLECLLLGLKVGQTDGRFPSNSVVSEILNARRLQDPTTQLREADVVIHGMDSVRRMGWFVRDGGEISRKGARDDTLQEDIMRVWRGADL